MTDYFIPTKGATLLENGARWYPDEVKLRLQHYVDREFGGFFELGAYSFGGIINADDVWILAEKEVPDDRHPAIN